MFLSFCLLSSTLTFRGVSTMALAEVTSMSQGESVNDYSQEGEKDDPFSLNQRETNVLVLTQSEPVHNTFILGGPTQLGRLNTRSWFYKNREKPDRFEKLEAIIVIEGSFPVSRIHAGIYKDEMGNYLIEDLHSLNGTFVNGQRIGRPVRLMNADRISLGILDLYVEGLRPEIENNHALLVGHSSGELENTVPSLDLLADELDKRGFANNITRLNDHTATKEKINTALKEVAYRNTHGAHFIFCYSGHGDHRGLLLGNEVLTPEEFYTQLRQIRGKKLVILDCCYAGRFIGAGRDHYHSTFISEESRKLMPSQCLVIAACKADERASWVISPQAGGRYVGVMIDELVKYLRCHREKFNLHSFQTHVEQNGPYLSMYGSAQTIQVKGEDFTVMLASTDNLRKITRFEDTVF